MGWTGHVHADLCRVDPLPQRPNSTGTSRRDDRGNKRLREGDVTSQKQGREIRGQIPFRSCAVTTAAINLSHAHRLPAKFTADGV